MFSFVKKPVITDEKRVDEVLSRSVEESIHKDDLRKAMLSGRRLRVKLGIDPTSPDIHIGRAVALLKLRDFQELGHDIVFIAGDFTGVIGDTSDKDSERPMLTPETVRKNMATYFAQAGKLLDMSRVEKRRNSSWLSKLRYADVGAHADVFSVADFIARENIAKRLKSGSRVSLREVLYPLMQGYDSVAVRADVELGGTDQRFNLLAGRKLQEKFGQRPQNIVMLKLIPGLDGRKMSSSWGNTVNLNHEPSLMYGKIMSVSDETVPEYFLHATRVPVGEIEALKASVAAGTMHPKAFKMRLAKEITALYHGKEAAQKAEAAFEATFAKGEVPEDAPLASVAKDSALHEAMLAQGIVKSKGEWKRLVGENAVSEIGGETVTDIETKATKDADYKIGKRRFLKIRIK